MYSRRAVSTTIARRCFSPAISSILAITSSAMMSCVLTLIILYFQFYVQSVQHGLVEVRLDRVDADLANDRLGKPIGQQVAGQGVGQAAREQIKQFFLL